MASRDKNSTQVATTNDGVEKTIVDAKHLEQATKCENDIVYDGEEEPEIHMRTWIALASMFLLNLVQVFALQGPPAVVGKPRCRCHQ